MSIRIIKGFKIYDSPEKKSIIVNSDHIDKCMQVYNENHLDGVAITTSHDYRLQNVDFLLEYPNIRHLSISDGIQDISAIHSLKNLKSLIISGKNKTIDFSYFIFLEHLTTEWSPYLLNLHECLYLRSLYFYKFNPKSKDCSSISNIPWVKRLGITKSSITNFKGLEEFESLEELEVNYCNELERLCCLEKSRETLVSLLFDHCAAISNYDYVKNFQNLDTLAYNNGGNIPSIEFVKKMTSLRSFRFLGTDVSDGDVSHCIGLKYAAFTNKKHFSHTMEQIKNLSDFK